MRPDEATRGTIPPVPSADAPIPPKLLDFQPVFDVALPEDWLLIGRSRGSGDAQGGCFVLAHPEVGVALVDLLPNRTPNAEALLRRLLNAADFSARCRGYLPVIHCEVAAEELPHLLGRIEDGFAYDSVLTIADHGRWVGVLWRTLQAGVTWEALGRAPTGGVAMAPRALRSRSVVRLARAGLLGLGLLGLFGLGFAAAVVTLPVAEPTPHPAPSGMIALAEAPSASPSAPPSAALPPVAQAGTAQAGTEAPPVAEEASVGPALADSPIVVDSPVMADSAETRTASLLPIRRAGRAPLPIDRRCSEALFRFQQGGSLSSQEMTHVRQGCASWR